MRLGSDREPGEGLRLGTVRRLPRGVRKARYAADNWFDLWLPELAPSAGLLSFATGEPLTPPRWNTFHRRYRSEMKKPGPCGPGSVMSARGGRQSPSRGEQTDGTGC